MNPRQEGFCCFPDQLASFTDEETEAQRPIICCMQFGRLLSSRSPDLGNLHPPLGLGVSSVKWEDNKFPPGSAAP